MLTVDAAALESAKSLVMKTHDTEWALRVYMGLARNGYGHDRGNGDRAHEENLHSVWSVAAMRAAVVHALENQQPVFAPLSGFHHAGFDFCGGYCTYNGLITSILDKSIKVLIIDGDAHEGDGTKNLIKHHKLRKRVRNLDLSYGAVVGVADAERQIYNALKTADGLDLVIYQAGADSHIDDDFMAGYLTDANWTNRDDLVFNLCKELGVPVVWNLAGGYAGTRTIDLHRRTFASALRVYQPGSNRLTSAPVDLSGKAAPLDLGPSARS